MALTQSQMKRLTAVHGWSGVILGLLLYVVVCTGTIVVFAPQIERWSLGVNQSRGLDVPLDAILRDYGQKLPKSMLDDVGVWRNTRGELIAFYHSHVLNPETGETEDYGTMFHFDPATGAVVDRVEGFVWQDPENWVESALEHFLVNLHVALYLPNPWGLLATGVLGLLMMAAALSGLLMHRHLIRDIFTTERPGGRLASVRDRHVLASTWGLPFAIILAFTGSYYSFAGTVTQPVLAQVAYAGDEDRLEAALFEPKVAEDARPVAMADLDRMIGRATEEAGIAPSFVSISNYGRADSRVRIWHPAPPGGLSFGQMVFEGATGTYLGTKPLLGNTESTGSTLVGLIWPLHTGDFAGFGSQLAWGMLGTLMGVVTLSGLRLWVRRRETDPLWRGFGRAVVATGYGVPLAVIACSHAYFLSDPFGTAMVWTPAAFVAASIACLVLAWRMKDMERLRRLNLGVLAYGLLTLPAMRLVCGGTSWVEALSHSGGTVVVLFDLLLLATGAGVLAWRRDGWVGRWLRPVATKAPEAAE